MARYRDDMSEDNARWLPDEGWFDLEVVSMVEGTSKQGNPKFTVSFALADDASLGIKQDITNIPGKRWLLRQLLESCGIEPIPNEEGKKIYDWEVGDIEGKTVKARIEHDKTPFIGRDGTEKVIPKAKICEFKKLEV